jgi:hypothetical protein
MLIRMKGFNIYLMVALALALICGCQSPETKRKKQFATFELHQEAVGMSAGRSLDVTLHRDPLIMMHVDRAPFLTEKNLRSAKVVDVIGGYALSIQFDQEGAYLLEQYTAALVGLRMAIFSQFVGPTEEKLNEGHWLAGLKVQNRISNGLLVFVPNVSREEADLIALQLNNVAIRDGNATGSN